MFNFKVRILVIGPQGCGKTTICNNLSGIFDNTGNESYITPTRGVRILEFEREAPRSIKKSANDKVDVELYDLSGNTSNEKWFAGFRHEIDGIIFVYDPDNNNDIDQMEQWFNQFAKPMRFKAADCMLLAIHKSANPPRSGLNKINPPQALNGMPVFNFGVQDLSSAQMHFDRQVQQLVDKMNRQQIDSENNMLK